jgi:predicted dehydrogenase
MSDRVRFAIVGAGGIAQGYSQALEESAEARLVAVADIRTEAARALAERSRCPSYGSHQALAGGSTAFDAVLVCTPPSSHEEIATYFLNRKVPVLCEKPFTLTSAGARQMTQLARQNGVQLTMAAKFRFVEDVIRAKSIVASGILGEIILFENAFTSRVDMSTRWNSDPRISGGGVLVDNGPHSVDLMRYFLGPLADVQVVAGKRVQGVPVEDTALIFVRSKSGIQGRIDLSWSINKELDSYIKIYGSHGTISVGWKESKYRQFSSPDWVVFGKGYNKVQALRSQLENFARALRGKEALLITAEDAVASVEVIEAANRALRDEHWISVERGHAPEGPVAVNGHIPAEVAVE